MVGKLAEDTPWASLFQQSTAEKARPLCEVVGFLYVDAIL